MFLVHPTLSDDEIDKTCDALNQVMRVASQEQVYVGELEENFV